MFDVKNGRGELKASVFAALYDFCSLANDTNNPSSDFKVHPNTYAHVILECIQTATGTKPDPKDRSGKIAGRGERRYPYIGFGDPVTDPEQINEQIQVLLSHFFGPGTASSVDLQGLVAVLAVLGAVLAHNLVARRVA